MKKEGCIHRISHFILREVNLREEYTAVRTLAEGCHARVLLAEHKPTGTQVVLKAIHKELTSTRDFFREFHYTYYLSPHSNILSCYDVAFKADDCFVFAQEFAPFGDLAGKVKNGGLPQGQVKLIAKQMASALEFMHSKDLVHRDLKLENILVFSSDFTKVKLCDFGSTRKAGTLVRKTTTWQPFLPPEICEIVKNEGYYCSTSSDVWQLGIVLFVCLTGSPPWQAADIADPSYAHFVRWQKRSTTKIPPQFKRFTPRLLRFFRRVLEPKARKRSTVTEVYKYLDDVWVEKSAVKTNSEKKNLKTAVCTQNNKRSIKEGKKNLRNVLDSYGIETTVDQKAVSKRIWDWILACEVKYHESNEGNKCP